MFDSLLLFRCCRVVANWGLQHLVHDFDCSPAYPLVQEQEGYPCSQDCRGCLNLLKKTPPLKSPSRTQSASVSMRSCRNLSIFFLPSNLKTQICIARSWVFVGSWNLLASLVESPNPIKSLIENRIESTHWNRATRKACFCDSQLILGSHMQQASAGSTSIGCHHRLI
jgi:hypothetical protein